MRLNHIFWSLLTIAVIIALPPLLFLSHGKLQGGPEIFGSYLICWWVIEMLSPIALIIAWAKRKLMREKFSFTLLAALNLYFGLRGIYYLVNAGILQTYKISFVLFLLNLAYSSIIIYNQLNRPAIAHRNA